MLKGGVFDSISADIKCKCGNDISKEFNGIEDFSFNIKNNIRSFGIFCNKCNNFIPITEFLTKSESLKIMNTFMNSICNL